MSMTEDRDLLHTLLDILQIISVLLLLFGAYLSTLKAVLTVKRTNEDKQYPDFSNTRLELSGADKGDR